MPIPLSSNPWSAYLRWMLATLALVLAATGAFNVFIDPLGVFDTPHIAGLNAIKPYLDHHRELSRYEGARRLCLDTGIFGNSRAAIGFDPQSPALTAHGLNAFNHAIPGTGPRSTYRQLLWLQAAQCQPKTVLLGIEFFDFLGGSVARPLPTLQTDPAPQRNGRFFAESVFSIAGLRDSITTLVVQRARYPATSTERGFNPLLNYIPEIEQNGHYALFRQRAEESARSWSRRPVRLQPPEGGASDDEVVLDAILAHPTATGGTSFVVIYPYHAEIRMMIERLGLGAQFAAWKRLVFASAMRQTALGGKVEVWDFSGIAPETLEAIPAKGDRRTRLAYYWEAGHFKKELGDLAMARVLGAPGEFGVKLDSAHLESWLTEDRARVQKLLGTPSPLLSEVDDVLSVTTGK